MAETAPGRQSWHRAQFAMCRPLSRGHFPLSSLHCFVIFMERFMSTNMKLDGLFYQLPLVPCFFIFFQTFSCGSAHIRWNLEQFFPYGWNAVCAWLWNRSKKEKINRSQRSIENTLERQLAEDETILRYWRVYQTAVKRVNPPLRHLRLLFGRRASKPPLPPSWNTSSDSCCPEHLFASVATDTDVLEHVITCGGRNECRDLFVWLLAFASSVFFLLSMLRLIFFLCPRPE